jgi:hypothetical protein
VVKLGAVRASWVLRLSLRVLDVFLFGTAILVLLIYITICCKALSEKAEQGSIFLSLQQMCIEIYRQSEDKLIGGCFCQSKYVFIGWKAGWERIAGLSR